MRYAASQVTKPRGMAVTGVQRLDVVIGLDQAGCFRATRVLRNGWLDDFVYRCPLGVRTARAGKAPPLAVRAISLQLVERGQAHPRKSGRACEHLAASPCVQPLGIALVCPEVAMYQVVTDHPVAGVNPVVPIATDVFV